MKLNTVKAFTPFRNYINARRMCWLLICPLMRSRMTSTLVAFTSRASGRVTNTLVGWRMTKDLSRVWKAASDLNALCSSGMATWKEKKSPYRKFYRERNKPEMCWYLRVETAAENSLENVDLFKCELSRSVVLVLNFAQIVRQSKLQVFDGTSNVRLVATSCRLRLGIAKNFPRLPNINCPINTYTMLNVYHDEVLYIVVDL